MQTEESLTHQVEHWRPCQCSVEGRQPPASCVRYQNHPGPPPEAWSQRLCDHFPTPQQRHQIPAWSVKKRSLSKLKEKPMWGELVP